MSEFEKEKWLSALFCPLSDIPDEEKRYLYRPWFPIGKLTQIVADPGVGKSKLTYALAAKVTQGLPLFDVHCGKAGRVLFFSQEDDTSDIKRTVAACGGDLEKVFILSDQEKSLSAMGDKSISFSSQIVEWAIQKYTPALVVFDPLAHFVGKVDMNKQGDADRALNPLRLLAKKHQAAIVVVSHTSKSSQNNLLYKASGSMSIIGGMRSALSVVRDPENTDQCIALHTKTNNGRGKAIRYAIKPIPGDEDFAMVDWIALEDYSERDYWKALKRRDEKEYATQITDDDAIVQTVLSLIRDNPAGVRLRKQDFWTAAETYTGQVVADGIDAIVKKYRRYLWDGHGVFIDAKTSQTLKPFHVENETILPSKSPDRCLAIYRKKGCNIQIP